MLTISTNSKIPKFILGITINDVVLPAEMKLKKTLLCHIIYKQNLACTFQLEKSKTRIDQLCIMSYHDKIQLIFIEEDEIEQIGSISFNAKIFSNYKSKTITKCPFIDPSNPSHQPPTSSHPVRLSPTPTPLAPTPSPSFSSPIFTSSSPNLIPSSLILTPSSPILTPSNLILSPSSSMLPSSSLILIPSSLILPPSSPIPTPPLPISSPSPISPSFTKNSPTRITLFDLPYDDEYDGTLKDDDEEIPKVSISFFIDDVPSKADINIKHPISKYGSTIPVIPEIKEEPSPLHKTTKSKLCQDDEAEDETENDNLKKDHVNQSPRNAGNSLNTLGNGLNTPGHGPNALNQGLNTLGNGMNTPGHGPNAPNQALHPLGNGQNTSGHGPNAPNQGLNTPGNGPNTPNHGMNTLGSSLSTPGQDPNTPEHGLTTPIHGPNASTHILSTPGHDPNTLGNGSNAAIHCLTTPIHGPTTPIHDPNNTTTTPQAISGAIRSIADDNDPNAKAHMSNTNNEGVTMTNGTNSTTNGATSTTSTTSTITTNPLTSLNTSEIPKMNSVESHSSLDLNVLQNWTCLTPQQLSKMNSGSENDERGMNMMMMMNGNGQDNMQCCNIGINDNPSIMNLKNSQDKFDDKNQIQDLISPRSECLNSIIESTAMTTNPSSSNLIDNPSKKDFLDSHQSQYQQQHHLQHLQNHPHSQFQHLQQHIHDLRNTLKVEYEEKLELMRLDLENLRQKEAEHARCKEQIEQLIEENKVLSSQNMELKQSLQAEKLKNQSSIPQEFHNELKSQYEHYIQLYKHENEKVNEKELICKKLADDIKTIQKTYQDKLRQSEDKRISLEETINTLRLEIQKLSYKHKTIENELLSKDMLIEAQLKEIEDQKKNLKLLKDKLDEPKAQCNKEHRDYEELKIERNKLKLELESIQNQRLKEEQEKIVVVEEHNAKMAELKDKINEIVEQFLELSSQCEKLKNENMTLRSKAENAKDLLLRNHTLEDQLTELKIENEKMKLSLVTLQDKLCLAASELVKHTTITINQNKVITQLNQMVKQLENANKGQPAQGQGHSGAGGGSQGQGQGQIQGQGQGQGQGPGQGVGQGQGGGNMSTHSGSVNTPNNGSMQQGKTGNSGILGQNSQKKGLIVNERGTIVGSQSQPSRLCKNDIHLQQLQQQQQHFNYESSSNHSVHDSPYEFNESPPSTNSTSNQLTKSSQALSKSTNYDAGNINNAPRCERSSFDFDSNSQLSMNNDLIDTRMSEYITKLNIPIFPIKIAEGHYRFGTKELSISLINDVAYITVMEGYITLEDFLKYYTPIELAKLRKLKGSTNNNISEYTPMKNETIIPEMRHLIIKYKDLFQVSTIKSTRNNRSISLDRKNSSSPKQIKKDNSKAIQSRATNSSSVNNNNANNSNSNNVNKKLFVEISKSNEGYVVRNKIGAAAEQGNKFKDPTIHTPSIQKPTSTKKPDTILDQIVINNHNNGDCYYQFNIHEPPTASTTTTTTTIAVAPSLGSNTLLLHHGGDAHTNINEGYANNRNTIATAAGATATTNTTTTINKSNLQINLGKRGSNSVEKGIYHRVNHR